ncbi:MAG: hypothetical protein IKY66_03045 [Bacteroidales bacterium]|nr:hypothetical protein [Bacteroidales bacterium]
MRKRHFIQILLLLLIPLGVRAETTMPGLTFGAEWGYTGTFYSGYHYNFYAPEGYRVDLRKYEFTYDSNAEAYLHIGYNLNENYNVSFYMGISAIQDYHHTLPLSVRLTRLYGNDHMKDRIFSFIDLGSGICVKRQPQEILTGKIGAGYRLSLSRDTKMDFILALRSVLTHPDIKYYGTDIAREKTNRNNAYISAFSLGISLTF